MYFIYSVLTRIPTQLHFHAKNIHICSCHTFGGGNRLRYVYIDQDKSELLLLLLRRGQLLRQVQDWANECPSLLTDASCLPISNNSECPGCHLTFQHRYTLICAKQRDERFTRYKKINAVYARSDMIVIMVNF